MGAFEFAKRREWLQDPEPSNSKGAFAFAPAVRRENYQASSVLDGPEWRVAARRRGATFFGAQSQDTALKREFGSMVELVDMPVNSTHPDYEAALPSWLRARDVLAGEDAVKAAGEKYVPRLDSQSDAEYIAYLKRAAFFNASARTAEGFVGLIFRRPPFIKMPENKSALGRALAELNNDADMMGTSLLSYAKNVVNEVIALGRCGSLIDWEGDVENRVYASLYKAESILNWRVERINGRNIPTMVVLHEGAQAPVKDEDPFAAEMLEQIRVLKLVPGEVPRACFQN